MTYQEVLTIAGYRYYETEDDFLKRYPYAKPYKGPFEEPYYYPSKSDYPLWAKYVYTCQNSNSHDDIIMDYVYPKDFEDYR